jgi:acyl carrier protein
VLDDGALLGQSWQRFAGVLAPKVAGAWNLHLATRGEKLDFFLLFSSAASLLGSPGQANYAAANAFLDGLAHVRRALDLPALSINWGPWAETGMAAARKLASHGDFIGRIGSNEGIELLERALAHDGPQLACVPIHWSRWRGTEEETPMFVSELARHTRVAHDEIDTDSLSVEDLMAAEEAEQHAMLSSRLRAELARVLRASEEHIDVGQSIHSLGVDSLASIELRNRIERKLGISIPAVSLVKGPTIAELAALVLDLLRKKREEKAKAPPPGFSDTASAELAHLNDEQVDALLSNLLAEGPA